MARVYRMCGKHAWLHADVHDVQHKVRRPLYPEATCGVCAAAAAACSVVTDLSSCAMRVITQQQCSSAFTLGERRVGAAASTT
jgi:hypothetical protein